MIRDHRPRPPYAARVLALVHTAMDDAFAAAVDSRRAHQNVRPRPAELEPRLRPVGDTDAATSYAPVQAAVAGAAEEMLSFLFTDRSSSYFARLATQAVRSRLSAGLNFPSDVTRARRLGRVIAARAIGRAQNDGAANAGFAHPRRAGEGFWSPTSPAFSDPPFGGAVGTWMPWVLETPGELMEVVPPPHAYGSEPFLRELNEVVDVQESLTVEQREKAYFWADGPGTSTPAGHWNEIALQLSQDYGLSPARTARLFALLNVAQADAAIATFDMKFYFWSIRPITAIWRLCDDRTRLCEEHVAAADRDRAPFYGSWHPLLETPSFPGYPSGHASFSGAAAEIIGTVIPDAASNVDSLAEEAAMSRLWGGIHFRSDDDAGLELGRAVGRAVIDRTL